LPAKPIIVSLADHFGSGNAKLRIFPNLAILPLKVLLYVEPAYKSGIRKLSKALGGDFYNPVFYLFILQAENKCKRHHTHCHGDWNPR